MNFASYNNTNNNMPPPMAPGMLSPSAEAALLAAKDEKIVPFLR
jgi:hypothetical protein